MPPRLIERLRRRQQAAVATPEVGQEGIDRPAQCDWAWRPAPWAAGMTPSTIDHVAPGTRLGVGVALHHDCDHADLSLSQAAGDVPHAITLRVGAFDGSFLSLALDLPADGAMTLRRHHVVILTLRMLVPHPGPMFARLNIRQGPNVDQLVTGVAPSVDPTTPVLAEFDLGFLHVKPARLEGAWVDLTFDPRGDTSIRIEDLTVTRRPRADL
ncbi:DUF6478 family protein [Jannaschia sp. 2305UL9-9]|uniref:DUF6478 family protein n=1 Tax=Jannaschia sp. 2305UL9-9 TaxID=3121638 RepID=UPI003527CF63